MSKSIEWIFCPLCGSKTRNKVREGIDSKTAHIRRSTILRKIDIELFVVKAAKELVSDWILRNKSLYFLAKVCTPWQK